MPWWIPFTAGLEDGINPCTLVTCAVVLVLRLWLEGKGLDPKKFLPVFIVSIVTVNFLLNLGFLADILSARIFQKTAVFIYMALALVFAGAGAVFFYDWVLLFKGKDVQNLFSRRMFQCTMTGKKYRPLHVAVIAAAVVTGVLSSIWPPNYYITILSNNLYVPGRFWNTAGLLAMYALVQMWLIICVAILFSWGRLTLRLRQVMNAAVFLSAAAAVVYEL